MPTTDRLAARRFELMAAEYLQRMGARIRERREQLDLSQEDIARALPGRTTGNQVSRWERGLHRPGDDTIEALATILDVDVAYFLAATPDKSETPDLMATIHNDGAGERLAAIEERLDQALEKIDELAVTNAAMGALLATLVARSQDSDESDEAGG